MKDRIVPLPLVTLWFAFMIYAAVAWGVNLWRLINCDFKPHYGPEIIYVVGTFTPLSLVTCWVDFEKHFDREKP